MRALLLLALVACTDDPSAQDVANDVNADITACAPGAWNLGAGDLAECARVCQSKPPVNAEAKGVPMCCPIGSALCEEARWIEVDGHAGVCGVLVFAPVKWWPCEE